MKFNLEAATPGLFAKMCPGLDYDRLWQVLDRSVQVFGKNRVFSNVIVGLGETDAELETCIKKLTPLAELFLFCARSTRSPILQEQRDRQQNG